MAVVGTAFLLPVGRALARIHVKSRGDGAEAAEDGAPVEGCTSCPPVGRKPALGPKKQSAIRLEIASSHDSLCWREVDSNIRYRGRRRRSGRLGVSITSTFPSREVRERRSGTTLDILHVERRAARSLSEHRV